MARTDNSTRLAIYGYVSEHPGDLPEDLVDWCGHGEVSTRTWRCPDCDSPLPDKAVQRLQQAPTEAPPGYVWVLDWRPRYQICDDEPPRIFGVFSDRSKIARLIVRGCIASAANIRTRNIHWYQSPHNRIMFEGWEERSDASDREEYVWSLELFEIDSVG